MPPAREPERVARAANRLDLFGGPFEIGAPSRRLERKIGIAWRAVLRGGFGVRQEVAVDARVRLERRVKAREFGEQLALTPRRLGVEGEVSSGSRRLLGAGIDVRAPVDAEQHVTQRRLEFARSDVDLVSLVHGLERLGQPLDKQAAAVTHHRIIARAEHRRRPPSGAVVLGGAGQARLPNFPCLFAADQPVDEVPQPLGRDARPVPRHAADQ